MNEPVYVNQMSLEKLKELINSLDYIFSDCDGVIWSQEGPLSGSGKFFDLIKKLGKKVHYVSNNSLRTKENYEARFKAAGIENGFENLTIPSTAIAEYLKSANMKKKLYCVTCPETIRVLESNGYQCKYGPDMGTDYYGDYEQYLEDDEEIGAVIFDSDFKVNLPKLYKATAYLKRPDVLYLNGATDRIVPFKPGVTAIGTGIFSDIVTDKTKREPVQLGKPGKTFGEFAMKRAGVIDPNKVLFIGDMIDQDVGLGKATGFKTMLVLTNLSKQDMLSHPTIRPDYYADGLGSLVPLLEQLL